MLLVVHAMRELDPHVVIVPQHVLDPDHIADRLLDVAERFDGTRLLYLLTVLQIHRLDRVAREICEQEFLLLDPRSIAEEAVISLYAAHVAGGRQVPFKSWARQVVQRTTQRAVDQPRLAAFRREESNLAGQILTSILAEKANRLGFDARRLIYMAWVRGLAPGRIARESGVPLETVEWVLATIMEQARDAVEGLLRDQGGDVAPGREVADGS